MRRRAAKAGSALLLTLGYLAASAALGDVRHYATRYYDLYTDGSEEVAKEAELRITLMAEEYHRRTQAFAGRVNQRLPFYLLGERETYLAAGGRSGTAGFYDGQRLVAMLFEQRPAYTWNTVQHEGFHQFVHAAMGNRIPIWANEGMAEYFAEGIFTGDSFYVGLIPQHRLKRVQGKIRAGKFPTLRTMLYTDNEIWSTHLSQDNYDLAWSMVHFLAHGDDGRYEQPLNGFLQAVSRGREWEDAWKRNFGADLGAFEDRWRAYWLELPDHPTADRYAEVRVAALTSFYARAVSQQQEFKTFAAFVKAARAGELRHHADDWLPPGLLDSALYQHEGFGQWSLVKKRGYRWLQCRTRSGVTLHGQFKIRTGRVRDVTVKTIGKRP